MFDFIKKKNVSKSMVAAADGKVRPMSEAKDEVFASCALGGGVLIDPTGDVVVAPADGTITVTMEGSNHAVGLNLDNGLEILLHIGVDTVELNGRGFKAFVRNGETVKAGQKLIEFDRSLIEKAGYCSEIMQIVTNSDSISSLQYTTGMDAEAGKTVVATWKESK